MSVNHKLYSPLVLANDPGEESVEASAWDCTPNDIMLTPIVA